MSDKPGKPLDFLSLRSFFSLIETLPIGAIVFGRDCNIIECNSCFSELLGASSKNEICDSFERFLPRFQIDGMLSIGIIKEKISFAFEKGSCSFLLSICNRNGEEIHKDVKAIKAEMNGHEFVIAYFMEMSISTDDAGRIRLMYEASPRSCCFWDSDLSLLDCNYETIKLLGVSSKQEFKGKFYDFSCEYQPDGMLSKEKACIKLKQAIEIGRVKFEWLLKNTQGELIPVEVIFSRVSSKPTVVIMCLMRDLREIKESENLLSQLKTLAFTDALTGAYNRHYFMETARMTFSRRDNNNSYTSIILFDLDRFKVVNDTFGHAAGDVVLIEIVKCVKEVLRANEFLARYGGEEFIIIASDSDANFAENLAWRIKKAVENLKVYYKEQLITITVSLGVALKTSDDETLEDLIVRADAALYRAKAKGRNTVVCYENESCWDLR